jgi:hypothetical protein
MQGSDEQSSQSFSVRCGAGEGIMAEATLTTTRKKVDL